MASNKFCQSCGLPLKKDPQQGGTNLDGTFSQEYCSYCFKDGKFTQPHLENAKQMQALVKEQLKQKGYSKLVAWLFTLSIPKLKRWQKPQ